MAGNQGWLTVDDELTRMFGPRGLQAPPQAPVEFSQVSGIAPPAGGPKRVEDMTPQEYARMQDYGSAQMGNVGTMQKQADMQKQYADAMRGAPKGQHWTQQATRAVSGIGEGLAGLEQEAKIKSAGDMQKYAVDLMTKPEMQTEQAKMLREQFSDAPAPTTKMDIFQGKLPDWLKDF